MAKTETIIKDLKTAMLKQDRLRISVLRLLLASLTNAKIAKKSPLVEAEELAVLSKEVKKREEAIELYQQGKRPELAEKEQAEIQIIKEYLPSMMSRKEVEELVLKLKASPSWPSEFGQAMRLVMVEVKGKADGKIVAEAVKQNL